MTRTKPTLAQKPPKPADFAATLRTLRAIHREMDGTAWSPDTCDRIAEHLRVAGFTLREPQGSERRATTGLDRARRLPTAAIF